MSDASSSAANTVRSMATNSTDDDFDEEFLMEEYLSEGRLLQLTQGADLSTLRTLEIEVDTTLNSLGRFGDFLPALKELRLSNSNIASIRHLGTSLKTVEILWMSRCSLTELEGISALPNLREVYFSFNELTDVSPLADLEHLQSVDLESNNIDDIDGIEFLCVCEELSSLNLERNPICANAGYRTTVCRMLPQLQTLDEVAVAEGDRVLGKAEDTAGTGGAAVDVGSEQKMVDESIKFSKARTTPSPAGGDEPPLTARPTTARPMTARSGGAPPMTARPMTARSGAPPGTARRPPMAWSSGTTPKGSSRADLLLLGEAVAEDNSSNLTHGSEDAFCGNPVMALRRRKLTQEPAEANPASADASPAAGAAPEDLLKEVTNWKLSNEAEVDTIVDQLPGEYDVWVNDGADSEHEAESDADEDQDGNVPVADLVPERKHPVPPTGPPSSSLGDANVVPRLRFPPKKPAAKPKGKPAPARPGWRV